MIKRRMGGFMQRIVSASRNDNGSVGERGSGTPSELTSPTLAVYVCVDCGEAQDEPWTCYGPIGAGEHCPPREAVAYVLKGTDV